MNIGKTRSTATACSRSLQARSTRVCGAMTSNTARASTRMPLEIRMTVRVLLPTEPSRANAQSFRTGEWLNDEKSGIGTYTWTNGDKYAFNSLIIEAIWH